MKLQTSIEFVKADVDKHKLIISSERPLKILSSAVHNGGFKQANKIINIHVPEDNEDNCNRNPEDLDKELHENPEIILDRAVAKLGIDSDAVVGIMTHADVRNVVVSNQICNDFSLSAFVTAGVEVAAAAGERTISESKSSKTYTVGTINVILLVDGNLTESCMVDAVKTVTEAKTVALRELDIRSCFSGDPASGTVTDSVVVASTKRGKPVKYAGTATIFGELLGKAVKESLKKTIHKEQNVTTDRCIMKRLKERRIHIVDVISLFLKAKPKLSVDLEQIKEEIESVLSDQRIVPFIIAGLRLDDDIKMGLIPNGKFDEDMAIGAFQTVLIKILGGKNSSEDLKEECTNLATVNNLGPFTRSNLAVILNSVHSKISNQ